MRTKLTAIGSLVALLLVGAGCTQPDTAPDSIVPEETQTKTAPVAPTAGTERRATQPTAPANRQAVPAPVEVSETDAEEPKTNPRLEQVNKLFDDHRARMGKAMIAADPLIRPIYDRPDWAKYEPFAIAVYDEGSIPAAAAVHKANEAFTKKLPNVELEISTALSALSVYLEKIQDFERKWGVSGI